MGENWHEDVTAYSEIEGRSNMVKESVLRFFPNLQQLTVATGGFGRSYQFSLREWFELFSSLSLKKFTVNGAWLKYVYPSVAEHFALDSVKVEMASDSLIFERV